MRSVRRYIILGVTKGKWPSLHRTESSTEVHSDLLHVVWPGYYNLDGISRAWTVWLRGNCTRFPALSGCHDDFVLRRFEVESRPTTSCIQDSAFGTLEPADLSCRATIVTLSPDLLRADVTLHYHPTAIIAPSTPDLVQQLDLLSTFRHRHGPSRGSNLSGRNTLRNLQYPRANPQRLYRFCLLTALVPHSVC
jgi:hypothetical protein